MSDLRNISDEVRAVFDLQFEPLDDVSLVSSSEVHDMQDEIEFKVVDLYNAILNSIKHQYHEEHQ